MQRFWFTIALVLVSVNVHAAGPLTIAVAVQEALANTPLIRQALADLAAADFAEQEARADYFPRLSAAYSYRNLAESPYVNIYGNPVVNNSRDQHHWEVALTQPLFSGLAILARHRIAKLGVRTRELELQQARQGVAFQVKQRCFNLLMAEKTLKTALSGATALAAHEADVRRFHENGLVPVNDLLKAQVARADAVQQHHRAQAGVKQARIALNLLLGRDYAAAVEIADPDPPALPVPPLDDQVARALTDRPEIAVLEKSIQSVQNQQLAAQSDYYPRVDLMGKYQQDGDDLGAGNNDYTNQHNTSVGVQASWTFFEFGKTRARSAKVRAQQRSLEQGLEKIKDDVRLQVVQARLDLDVAAQNIDTARTARDQASEHWRITNLLYQQQLTTSTEVLDARTYLDHAESAYYGARYGYGIALAGLEWAIGKKE